ncbi:MAG: hypothetical protein EBZ69_07455 [Alphaproteobacteria bacterium]|nr:hypothetical protein [Alphaproteobacteria bacterium]NDC56627.1 hypothetical protein [Alphaproteobacteria bacterium]
MTADEMNFEDQLRILAEKVTKHDPQQKLSVVVAVRPDTESFEEQRKHTEAMSEEFKQLGEVKCYGRGRYFYMNVAAARVPELLAFTSETKLDVFENTLGMTANTFPVQIQAPQDVRHFRFSEVLRYDAMSEDLKKGLESEFARYGATITKNDEWKQYGMPPHVTVRVNNAADWKAIEKELLQPLMMERVTEVYTTSRFVRRRSPSG